VTYPGPTHSTADIGGRDLHWADCLNARDLGGLPAAEGRIRPGALVRSDSLTRLTPSGRSALLAHGVRTIVDVRSRAEVERDWDQYPFRDGEVAYRNVPFTMSRDERAWDDLREHHEAAQSRQELNRLDLARYPAGIAAIVVAIAEAAPGGVLVHCHAGKDRTGLVIALLLSTAGVAEGDIADDYALTARNIELLIEDWLQRMTDDEDERRRLRLLAEPSHAAMLDTLAYVRAGWGSAEGYLLDAGVTVDQVGRVRTRLVEPAAGAHG